jgi:hypothetical protein
MNFILKVFNNLAVGSNLCQRVWYIIRNLYNLLKKRNCLGIGFYTLAMVLLHLDKRIKVVFSYDCQGAKSTIANVPKQLQKNLLQFCSPKSM